MVLIIAIIDATSVKLNVITSYSFMKEVFLLQFSHTLWSRRTVFTIYCLGYCYVTNKHLFRQANQ